MNDDPWPELVVFDLDFTLWDAGGLWCDCLRPPFDRIGQRVLDAKGGHVRVYPDVAALLGELPNYGCQLALASRTGEPAWARELLRLLDLSDVFPFQAIYPSDKQRHFQQLQEESGIAYEDMLFFDDEERNIHSVRTLGVTCQLVGRGVTREHFTLALSAWRKARWSA